MVTVHVAGRVKAPGVYELASGQRVLDAVRTAGGQLPDANLDELNLAAALVDGDKVYVPPVEEAAPPAPSGQTRSAAAPAKPSPAWLEKHPVNVNTASEQQLQRLPGVGPVTARSIVSERRANGPYRKVDDLTRVRGIGEKTLAKLRKFIRV